ncbi:MAG: hypothetical protein J07HQW1_00280 [Haloquadratum walsbyi J07HQW1]|uniref:Uncharacterized protein n=1 Tax=Haloquadratum walsbyi J07HQW1 TaxID=1238424 RepID=U1P9N9_9EURY|nr:MAG: hypothetical protein J07HQW1_00280 [Haloquadratum walsbyi J07HQW1]
MIDTQIDKSVDTILIKHNKGSCCPELTLHDETTYPWRSVADHEKCRFDPTPLIS